MEQSYGSSNAAKWYSLLAHIFGYQSTTVVSKGIMKLMAKEAELVGLYGVAKALREAYVDDINTSVPTKDELIKLQDDIKDFMQARGFPLKWFALSGRSPDTELSDETTTLVGGWKWFSEEDTIQFHTHWKEKKG